MRAAATRKFVSCLTAEPVTSENKHTVQRLQEHGIGAGAAIGGEHQLECVARNARAARLVARVHAAVCNVHPCGNERPVELEAPAILWREAVG